MVKINGADEQASGSSLGDWLKAKGYGGRMIAVEYNGEIISREHYPQVVLHDGDVVEIVCFMGGG
jgi:sulfur carrier protein